MQVSTVIEPKKSAFKINFRELYEYRELLWTLTYRDFRVKYAQTILGFSWAVLNPFLQIFILSFVFGTVAKAGTGNVEAPHLIYTTAGMLGYTYFSNLMTQAGSSIIMAQQMVKKIYFPRLVIPLSKAITGLIDLLATMVILGLMMVYYQYTPGGNIIYLPFFILIAVLSGLAAGIWMSALTVRFRDFQQVTPLIVRLGMYATPIAYPASLVPEKYLTLYYMNPMAGVVEGVRWCIVGGDPPSTLMYLSFGLIAVLFVFGIFFFNRVERMMADIL
ncbi:ABC transporter permease [Pontibacter sp. G13]|uniref:ABC transporter permease n=1 Tax=Pontibacter sp. G13 TaxID=3074898 RepID=UPI00288ADEDC|nr:ABC transporter permease [Pontibacter sp. G13]WNJ16398.1 ABC transporter permease [Pontibacter sp. G13]